MNVFNPFSYPSDSIAKSFFSDWRLCNKRNDSSQPITGNISELFY